MSLVALGNISLRVVQARGIAAFCALSLGKQGIDGRDGNARAHMMRRSGAHTALISGR